MILSMDSGHGKVRMNAESDRLSNLPDDLIHKILSFISIKQAIETSALSSRWRHIWTSMGCLNFSSEDFHTCTKFSKFVTNFLPRRNNQIEVYSVKLTFRGMASEVFVKRILDYAFSHNVQHLNVTCFPGTNDSCLIYFSSTSLKTFTLTGCRDKHLYNTPSTWELPPDWNLPALTTLDLHYVRVGRDSSIFAKCANLKNLTLKNCLMGLHSGFSICHSGLSSLTLQDGCDFINVDTPLLKNLTVKQCHWIHLISTTDLCSLHYEEDCSRYPLPLQLSTECLHLEKADICIPCSPCCFDDKAFTQRIVCLLQQLRSVKFLTLNLELVKEIISKRNIASAIKFMKELEVLLDQWKENFETNTTSIEQVEVGNHRSQIDRNMKWKLGERMTHIKSYWEDLNEQLEKGYKNTRRTISILREIEGMVTKLPTSHWDKFQARYSALCAEAETFMDIMMDRMKTLSDKKPGHSNIYSHHELATPSHPSS
ncbi:hypothetical protein SSX86_029534 [Deinandra increscens subsp. villosa]|uniref:F-box domain-containing protein n=1 Tax=Deinandra increscens subsp. villosa TaxID=3103831 RepID=A0AAP0GLV6_9ASTR